MFLRSNWPALHPGEVAVEAAESEEMQKEDADFNDPEYDNDTVHVVYIGY